MLVELRKLPPTSPIHSVTGANNTRAKGPKRKPQMIKKKTRNLIKENQTEDETDEINPISRLIHYAQSNKAKEPIYTMLDERGSPRHREFVMEVLAVNQKAQGAGSTKKLAKRQAAESKFTKHCNTKSILYCWFFARRSANTVGRAKSSSDQNEWQWCSNKWTCTKWQRSNGGQEQESYIYRTCRSYRFNAVSFTWKQRWTTISSWIVVDEPRKQE